LRESFVNVVFVNSMRTLGGGERWLLEAASGLRLRGHTTAVAARTNSALAAHAAEDGHRVLELPMRGDLDVDTVVRLARWLRSLKSDLVCVSVQRAVRIGSAAAKIAGVPAVVERRGLVLPLPATLVNRLVYGHGVTAVVANCAAIRDDVQASGLVDASRVSVIVNGIDAGRIPAGGGASVREELGIPADVPVVAVLGRLVRDKAHDDALRAFATILSRQPAARLLIAGGGKLEGEIRSLAAELAPAGSVIFAGHRNDVPAVLDASDVVLVTSHREGMPHVVLEAMAAGKPIVATRVAGIPEMIEHGREGLLVDAGATDAAAGEVLSLLGDRALAERLGAAARRRVLGEFSITTMIDRVEACFAAEIEAARDVHGESLRR
jgi:glycosyltransferase involved in cell wall biosynthesis